MDTIGESSSLLRQHSLPAIEKLPSEHGTFWQRLRNDRIYRAKIISTVYITWGFAVFGWLYGQIGPTLPDLQLLLDLDLRTASWLFTSFSFGYMIGCLFSGAVDGKIDSKLMLFIYLFGAGASTVAVPWCPALWLMLCVRVVQGVFTGGIDTASHAELFAIWKGDIAMYVQITYFFFGLGGVLTPMATKPFLAHAPHNSSNSSAVYEHNSETKLNGNSFDGLLSSTASPNCTNCSNPETHVQWAFLITGALIVSSSLPFLYQYFAPNTHEDMDSTGTADGADIIRKKPSRSMFIFIVCCLIVFMTAVSGWVDAFAGYLMTFCIHELNWTKPTGSLITSLFWVAFSFGNFACIFLVQFISTTTLLFSFFTMAVIGHVGLLVGSWYFVEPLIWACVLVIGFTMSTMWPPAFTWTEETVTEVSGRVSSMLCVSTGVGLMINPLAMGYSMDNLGYMWYTYILLGESVAVYAVFAFIVFLYTRLPRPLPGNASINVSD